MLAKFLPFSFLCIYSLFILYLGCKNLGIFINFLVLWFIFQSSSIVHFNSAPKSLTRRTTQVFFLSIRFLQKSKVSRIFLVLLRYYFLIFFLHLCLMLSSSNVPKQGRTEPSVNRTMPMGPALQGGGGRLAGNKMIKDVLVIHPNTSSLIRVTLQHIIANVCLMAVEDYRAQVRADLCNHRENPGKEKCLRQKSNKISEERKKKERKKERNPKYL